MKKSCLSAGMFAIALMLGTAGFAQTGKPSDAERKTTREVPAAQPVKQMERPQTIPASQTPASTQSKTSVNTQAPASTNRQAGTAPVQNNVQQSSQTRPANTSNGNKPAPSGKVVPREAIKEAK
ncbi:MAG: hypothetical protein MH137_04125 [Flavobacteriales bacterium]|nr:hypothetical protein [Flavobacteriales bacterium]